MKWFLLDRNTWNHLTVKENELRFVWDIIWKMITNHVYLMYKSRKDLSLNDLQILMWDKNKPTNKELFLTFELRTFLFIIQRVKARAIP